jgi:hypothetical protein
MLSPGPRTYEVSTGTSEIGAKVEGTPLKSDWPKIGKMRSALVATSCWNWVGASATVLPSTPPVRCALGFAAVVLLLVPEPGVAVGAAVGATAGAETWGAAVWGAATGAAGAAAGAPPACAAATGLQFRKIRNKASVQRRRSRCCKNLELVRFTPRRSWFGPGEGASSAFREAVSVYRNHAGPGPYGAGANVRATWRIGPLPRLPQLPIRPWDTRASGCNRSGHERKGG